MKDKILYFPYINVPQNEWFTQVLLYWEGVGSIVPRDFVYEPEKLHPHMRELVQENLVHQIIPDMYSMRAGSNFSKPFIQLIEKYGLNEKARNSKYGPAYSSRIHIDKFGYEITEYLVTEKLAFREEYPWYRVESITAGLFMTYLASFLGNSEELNMQPFTDDISSLATFSEEYAMGEFSQFRHLDKMRIDVLKEVLPVPRNGWDASKIVRFKEEYGDLLPKFRKKIEDKLTEISFIEDVKEVEFHLDQFKSLAREEIDELASKMKEKNWGGIVFGTICGLGAAAIPGAKAVLTNDWTTGLEAIPGVLGAVYSAYEGFKGKQHQLLNSPFAYAAFMDRKFR